MDNLIWLASYPKSGNTWFRTFLQALLQENEVNINRLSTSSHALRYYLDDALELESANLNNKEIRALMPEYYRFLSQNQTQRIYSKTHEQLYRLANGNINLPPDITHKALYFVRNPLEVAVSYAHHNTQSVDRTITRMADDNAELNASGRASQIYQYLGSWSGHVRSWMNNSEFPVMLVKYEDMLLDSLNTFTRICAFLELEYPQQAINEALQACSFAALQAQEQTQGFHEKKPNAQSFFRSGCTDSWKGTLTPKQIQRIVADHGEVMARLGYQAK